MRVILRDLACILVHHNSFPDVLLTVEAITAAGVNLARMLVVDNTGSQDVAARLRDALPDEVALLVTQNRGYAAAVNAGLDHLAKEHVMPEFVLVTTHESIPRPDAIGLLVDALSINPNIAVVGPALVDANTNGDCFWSLGGTLSPILRLPGHVGWGSTVSAPERGQAILDSAWVDGAFAVYRWDALAANPLREDFFLYFEETECHTRMRSQGWTVAVVPEARVSQSSAGIPPYWHARNLTLFEHAHGTRMGRAFGVLAVFVKSLVKVAVGRTPSSHLAAFIRGWIHGRQLVRKGFA